VTLPASITIGPFFINVDPLKQFLINKRRDIADKLLKMLAERLHGKTKSICEQYRQINNRLSEKPRAIEHIYQVRAWIETIPEAIRALEEMMRTTLFEYEILEHFWYGVSNEVN
jgi:dynein heavy chain, axonemal